MTDVNFGDLVERMAISLAVVLGLMYVAYRIVKRRQSSSFSPVRSSAGPHRSGPLKGIARSSGASAPSSRRAANTKNGLRVVGRLGLSRTTTVIAIQFADRVFLIGTAEQTPPSVLAEIDVASWTSSLDSADDAVPDKRVPLDPSRAPGSRRPTLLETLREATARRA